MLRKIVIPLVLLTVCIHGRAQLNIVTSSDATALAQRLVGDGVIISNAQISGSPFSAGFFTNQGGLRLGLDSGIVLTNGRAESRGANVGLSGMQTQNADNQVNTPGDPALSQLINGAATFDANILEFDFVPLGDTIRFRYVFSSEEYPEYNCTTFNDVFAFFISGPGITGTQNIALVPGTTIPVAINSINDGTVVSGNGGNLATCQNIGLGSPFTGLYNSNLANQLLTHDGLTIVLEAVAIVQPCQTYRLKIAIADAFDRQFDSGVFLEAKSLSASGFKADPVFPIDNGLPYLVEGCNTGSFKVLAPKKLPIQQLVSISFGGTAINGTDVATIPSLVIIPANDSVAVVPVTPIVDNIAEGVETFKIYISGGCANSNFFSDSIVIDIRDYDKMTMTPADSIGVCKNIGFQIGASAGYTTYQWDNDPTLSSLNIRNPMATPVNDRTVYVCTASLGACNARDSVVLKIKNLELLSKTDVNCRNGATGVINTAAGWEWKKPLQFSINNGTPQADSSFTNLAAGTYVVKVTDADNCVDSVTVTLIQAFPDLNLQETIVNASCTGQNGQVSITGTGGRPGYEYATDGINYVAGNNFTVNGGNQTIYIRDQNGCLQSKNILIPNDPPINITEVITPAGCSGNADGTITVTATGGSGVYEYALGTGAFQSGNVLNSISGAATINIRDNKGCTAAKNIQVPLTNTVTVDAGNNAAMCEGTSSQLNAVSSATVFNWTPAATLNNAAIANPVARPATTTQYFVTATSGICTRTDSVTILVNPAPVPNAGPDSTICVGRTINLNGTGGTQFAWTPDTYLNVANTSNPQTRPQKTILYRLMVTDALGCESLKPDSVKITVTPAVKIFAGNDTIAAIGQPMQLQAVELSASGVTSYTWSPATGLNNSAISNPIAILDRDMRYTVTGKTPQDCEGSDEVFVKVYKGPEIYVPDIFTPNGDGLNDRLSAIPVGMKTLKNFTVYNRLGQQVFNTARAGDGWDGNIKGVQQSAGSTYVWFAEAEDYTGKIVRRKGTVVLLR